MISFKWGSYWICVGYDRKTKKIRQSSDNLSNLGRLN